MANEPGQAIVRVLDEIIETIKSTRPVRSDNKPLEDGFVYSQLVLGQMVDIDTYGHPWAPMGGATLQLRAGGCGPRAGRRRSAASAFVSPSPFITLTTNLA